MVELEQWREARGPGLSQAARESKPAEREGHRRWRPRGKWREEERWRLLCIALGPPGLPEVRQPYQMSGALSPAPHTLDATVAS